MNIPRKSAPPQGEANSGADSGADSTSTRKAEAIERLLAARHPDIGDELRFHMLSVMEDALASGLDSEAALRSATSRFHDLDSTIEELEAIRHSTTKRQQRLSRMHTWLDIIQNTLRTATRHKALSVTIALLMGIGLGATAITFGLLDRLLLQPRVGIAEPEQLRLLQVEREFFGRTVKNTVMSYPDFLDFEKAGSISGIAATSDTSVTLGRGESAERVRLLGGTGDYFDVLGTKSLIGRTLVPSDDHPAAAPVAVIGYELWQRRFDGRDTVLGETLDLPTGDFTVVGVTPRGFSGTGIDRIDVWVSISEAAKMMISDNWRESRGVHWLKAVTRVRNKAQATTGGDRTFDADAIADRAAVELTTLHRLGRADHPRSDPNAKILLEPIDGPANATAGKVTVAGLLSGVSLLLLVLVCTNSANLLLANSLRKRRDSSVRLALGISRRRLITEQISYGLLLASLGGALAIVVNHWGGRAVRALLLPDIAWTDAGTSSRTVAMIAIAVLVAGVGAAILPALEAKRAGFGSALGRGRDQIDRTRARRVLLALQVTLTAIMLIGAGLFVRSFEEASAVDLGFDADGLIMLSLEGETTATNEDRQRDVERALEWLMSRPELDNVSVAAVAPFRSSWSVKLRVPGLEELPRTAEGGPYIYPVDSAFFDTMGLEIVQGRGLQESDAEGSPLVAVVNETMAESFWPGESPIGKCIIVNDEDAPCTAVVGVVENAHRQALVEGTQHLYYVPEAQGVIDTVGRGTLYARTRIEEAAAAAAIKQELLPHLSSTRSLRVTPFLDLVAPYLETWKLGATLFGAFGVLALLVASAGLYSTLAFEVARRKREIGVRSALGADAAALGRFVIGQGLGPVLAGLVAGILLARAAAPLIREQLFNVPASDLTTFAVVVLAMLSTAALAVAIPAFRAARMNVVEHLSSD